MIAPDEVIEAADLDALVAAALATLKVDNAQLPIGHYIPIRHSPISSFAAARLTTTRHIIPFDCFLEAVAVRTNDVVGDVSVAITNSGTGRNFPVTIEGTAATGVTNFTRLLYDGTKGSLADFATTSRALRVWNKGSITTVVGTADSVAANATLDIVLVLRSIFGRD